MIYVSCKAICADARCYFCTLCLQSRWPFGLCIAGIFYLTGAAPHKARMIFCTAVCSEEKLFSLFCFGLAPPGVKNRNARKVKSQWWMNSNSNFTRSCTSIKSRFRKKASQQTLRNGTNRSRGFYSFCVGIRYWIKKNWQSCSAWRSAGRLTASP